MISVFERACRIYEATLVISSVFDEPAPFGACNFPLRQLAVTLWVTLTPGKEAKRMCMVETGRSFQGHPTHAFCFLGACLLGLNHCKVLPSLLRRTTHKQSLSFLSINLLLKMKYMYSTCLDHIRPQPSPLCASPLLVLQHASLPTLLLLFC